ncbi:hypothetical protein TNCV_5042071 [Trichonephila clavipes]|uniref:Uncharacterized protein n=1 Tax=Trichonephila clavipes TaxID=2585209 RepID=A0A8X6R7T6_TRICX|nr:hypothetical protein TNCV_5042071 [Trichonephila clavipes]
MPYEQRGMSPKKENDLRRPLEHLNMWNEFVCQFRPVKPVLKESSRPSWCRENERVETGGVMDKIREKEKALPWIERTGEESPVFGTERERALAGENLRRALRRLEWKGRKDDERPGGVQE